MMDEVPVGLMPADIHIVIINGDDLALICKLPLDQLYRFLCIIFVQHKTILLCSKHTRIV